MGSTLLGFTMWNVDLRDQRHGGGFALVYILHLNHNRDAHHQIAARSGRNLPPSAAAISNGVSVAAAIASLHVPAWAHKPSTLVEASYLLAVLPSPKGDASPADCGHNSKRGRQSRQPKKSPHRHSISTSIDAAAFPHQDSASHWIDTGSGNLFKVLRISKETGAASASIKAPAGQVNAPHTHLGPADFYVFSGALRPSRGSAKAGDWVYEPAARCHVHRHPDPVDTVYLANVYGPVAFHGKDGAFAGILDGARCRRWLTRRPQKEKALTLAVFFIRVALQKRRLLPCLTWSMATVTSWNGSIRFERHIYRAFCDRAVKLATDSDGQALDDCG